MKEAKIFLLDLHPGCDLCEKLQGIFKSPLASNFQVQEKFVHNRWDFKDTCELTNIISKFCPDVIFLISSSTQLSHSAKLIQLLQKETVSLPIIVVLENGNPHNILEFLEQGAIDFIIPPLRVNNVLPRTWRLLKKRQKDETLTDCLKEKLGLKQLVGESPLFLQVLHKIPLLTKCDATILISGETGTGKELCARAIHYLSARAYKPFVPVNCGAIPIELVENELFGHAKGAFTGASSHRCGLIQKADGGTIFLDEIDCLPNQAQIKLLRFLQEKEYRPIGSTKVHQSDIRVIAATNSNLEEKIAQGTFRKDFYYRLNCIPLTLPPLRKRLEDIPRLTSYFLEKYVTQYGKQKMSLAPDALHKLICYDWPGNVRQLENIISHVVLLSDKSVIQSDDFTLPNEGLTQDHESFKETKEKIVNQFEISYIKGVLLAHKGNITRAAQAAKKDRRAFWQLMRKHQIDVQSLMSGHDSAQL